MKRHPFTRFGGVALLVALAGTGCATVRPARQPVTPAPTEHTVAVIVTRDDTHAPIVGATTSVDGLVGMTNQDGYAAVTAPIVPLSQVMVTAEAFEPYVGTYALGPANADVPIALHPAHVSPPRPTRAQVLDYKGHLADLTDSKGRVIWTPALSGASPEVRKEWLATIAANGGTHVPLGDFQPGVTYPGVEWANPDWTHNPEAIHALLLEILDTPGPTGAGLVPVVFLHSGGPNPRPTLTQFFPVAVQAFEGLWDSILTIPTGWEPVVGDWHSADVSWALETWHAYAPRALIGYHGSPARLVGSSNPLEPDDPWQGAEAGFYTSHGGQFIDIALYQTPHGRELYDDCDPASDNCWLNRFSDYVTRIGAGFHGWRQIPIALYESCAYEYFHHNATVQQCRQLAQRARDKVCLPAGVRCGFGNGLP